MMIIKKILGWSTVVTLGLTMLAPTAALAGGTDVQFTADTNVSLTGPSLTLTFASGGKVSSYSVSTTVLTINLDVGSTVTVKSTALATLTNSISSPILCSGTAYSYITLTGGSGPSTVTVTPTSAVVCSSGGGGGGASGVFPSPTPTPAPTPVPTPTPTPVPTPTPPPTSGSHPDGTLVKDGNTLYLIKNGQRIGFRNPQEYFSYGYKFTQAVNATDADRSLATTSVAKAMEGTLVLDASDNRTVYMIGTGNTKRGFVSSQVFKSLGYSFSGLPKIDLTDYSAAPAIGSTTDPHPDGSLVLAGKTIWWVRANQKQGFESMTVFNTYGFNLKRLVTANSADLSLPEGQVVQLRDGTLVLDNGTYYLISNGKKLPFGSMQSLTNLGYNTNTAVKTGLSNYSQGTTL
jgi:hypothetical protein